MISRERVIRTLNHQPIDRVPRDLWLEPGLETERADDVAEINVRFPADFLHLESMAQAAKRQKAQAPKGSAHRDAWGCVWNTETADGAPQLVSSPLAGASPGAVGDYQPPAELLDRSRFDRVNPTCEGTGRFTLASSEIRPLERLFDLRGPEAQGELAQGNVELRGLLDNLHEFHRAEAESWGKTVVDGVAMGDDFSWALASCTNLKLWRAIVKPLLRQYCSILHACDKFVFFQARGPLSDLLDDLIEIGVDAVHGRWPLEEFLKLAAARRGRIVFWGGLESRRLEPAVQPAQVRECVLRIRKAADFGAGGIISQISWLKTAPLRNIAAYFEQWMVPLPVTI